MSSIDKIASTVAVFLVVTAITLLVVGQIMSGAGVGATDLTVNVEDNTTSVGSGTTVELYKNETGNKIATEKTDSNGEVVYRSVKVDNVYVEVSGYQSDLVSLDASNVEITVDVDQLTTTVDNKNDDTFAPTFRDIVNQTTVIYGLLLVLPLVLVGRVAISMFQDNNGGGGR